jgi:hypothetical protein
MYLFRLCTAYSGRRAHSSVGGYSVEGSTQRYLEEFALPEAQPVYLPGDTIRLRLRVSHEVNLGSVWAVFRRLPERGEVAGDPHITFPGKHYTLSRAGAVRASEVYFEIEVSRDRHLPGYYELEAVRAYPYELDGRDDLSMEFEVSGEVCFRIAEEPTISSPRVTGWKLD